MTNKTSAEIDEVAKYLWNEGNDERPFYRTWDIMVAECESEQAFCEINDFRSLAKAAIALGADPAKAWEINRPREAPNWCRRCKEKTAVGFSDVGFCMNCCSIPLADVLSEDPTY